MASIRLIYDNNLSKQDNIIVIDDTKKDMYINLHLESSKFNGLKLQMEYLANNYINNQDYKDFNIYITADGNSRIFINDDKKTVTICEKNYFPKLKDNQKFNISFNNRYVYSDEKTSIKLEENTKNVSTAGVRLITSQFAKFLEYNSDLIDWVLYITPTNNNSTVKINDLSGIYFSDTKSTDELEKSNIISKENKLIPSSWFTDHGFRFVSFKINDTQQINGGSLNLYGESISETIYNWGEYINYDIWDNIGLDNTNKFREQILKNKLTKDELINIYNSNIKELKDIEITGNVLNINFISKIVFTNYISFIINLTDNHPRWDKDFYNKNINTYEHNIPPFLNSGEQNDNKIGPFIKYPIDGINNKYFGSFILRDLKIMNIHLPPYIHIDDIIDYDKYSSNYDIKIKDSFKIDNINEKLRNNDNIRIYTNNLLTKFIKLLYTEIIKNPNKNVRRDFYFCFKFYSDLINNSYLLELFLGKYKQVSSSSSVDYVTPVKNILTNFDLNFLGLQEVNSEMEKQIKDSLKDYTNYSIYTFSDLYKGIKGTTSTNNELFDLEQLQNNNYIYSNENIKMIYVNNTNSTNIENNKILKTKTTGIFIIKK